MNKRSDGSYVADISISEEDVDFLQRKYAGYAFADPDQFLQALINGAINKARKLFGEGPLTKQTLLDMAVEKVPPDTPTIH